MSPSLHLRLMTTAEFPAYRESLVRDYAADRASTGVDDKAAALVQAERQTAALLPEGLETPDTLLYVAQDDGGATIGYAWVATQGSLGGGPRLFDIQVKPHPRPRIRPRSAELCRGRAARPRLPVAPSQPVRQQRGCAAPLRTRRLRDDIAANAQVAPSLTLLRSAGARSNESPGGHAAGSQVA